MKKNHGKSHKNQRFGEAKRAGRQASRQAIRQAGWQAIRQAKVRFQNVLQAGKKTQKHEAIVRFWERKITRSYFWHGGMRGAGFSPPRDASLWSA